MRILHVLDHSVPLHSGYSFRTLAILRQQRALGWDTVHLTTPRHTAPGPDPETVDGLEFHRTPWHPARRHRPGLREPLEMRATARRLEALAFETRPDVLHAHSPVLTAWPALRVGRRLGIPVVYEVRAFWEDAAVTEGACAEGGLRYRLSRRLETAALRRADAVTTICEGLRRDMVGRGIPADRITVIPNAVDPLMFEPPPGRDPELAARHGLDGAVVLGFIGSFYRYEGLELLVRALPAILDRRPETRLLLVGGGPEEDRLRRMAAAAGLSDRVAFAGRVPHGEVGRYYSLVDLFVYPRISRRITELVTPLKPLESMAMGKVVLASDVGGHRELIRDGDTGFLFRPDDPDSLAETVLRAIGRRAQWPDFGLRGRRFVERERSWPAVVARYGPVYERLAGGDLASAGWGERSAAE